MYLTLKHLIDRYGAKEIVEVSNDRTQSNVSPDALKTFAEGNDPSPSDDMLIIKEFVESRIVDAEAYVMSFVHTIYNISEFNEDNVPKDLRSITAQIARYYLHENRMNQRVYQGFQDAQIWLTSMPKVGRSESGEVHRQKGVIISASETYESGSRVFPNTSEERFTEGYKC